MGIRLNQATPAFLAIFVATLAYLPSSVNLLEVGNKPIDIIVSDALIVCALILFGIRLLHCKFSALEMYMSGIVLFSILFFILLAFIGSLQSGSIVPLLSALKYLKPLLSIIAGIYFARVILFADFWRISTIASLLVVVGLCIGQFVIEANLRPRWGELVYSFDVYGFPNSAAQYYVFFVMFLFSGFILNTYKWACFIGLIILISFIILSLSRSGALVLFLFFFLSVIFILSLKQKFRIGLLSIALLVLMGLIFAIFEVGLSKEIGDAVSARIDRTFSHEDPTSGRFEIAAEAMQLVAEKPIFGYKFDSFSNYHEGHSTPHNQYIEAVFKTGLLGFIWYFSIVFILLWICYRKTFTLNISYENKKRIQFFLAAVICLLVGNLTQPNFTHSHTGNMVFFLLGFISNVRIFARVEMVPCKITN